MTIKLTADRILISVPIISTILRERRPMPQRGKLLFAMAHTALLPKWNTINAQRDDIIKEYDFHPLIRRKAKPTDTEEEIKRGWVEETSEEFAVPTDKLKEFEEKWKPIGAEEFDVEVKPIPLKSFDLGTGSDGSIEGSELIELGELIEE